MPLHVGDQIIESDYCIQYKKGKESIAVCAPNMDDAKALFTWAAQQAGLITP